MRLHEAKSAGFYASSWWLCNRGCALLEFTITAQGNLTDMTYTNLVADIFNSLSMPCFPVVIVCSNIEHWCHEIGSRNWFPGISLVRYKPNWIHMGHVSNLSKFSEVTPIRTIQIYLDWSTHTKILDPYRIHATSYTHYSPSKRKNYTLLGNCLRVLILQLM